MVDPKRKTFAGNLQNAEAWDCRWADFSKQTICPKLFHSVFSFAYSFFSMFKLRRHSQESIFPVCRFFFWRFTQAVQHPVNQGAIHRNSSSQVCKELGGQQCSQETGRCRSVEIRKAQKKRNQIINTNYGIFRAGVVSIVL